MTKTNRLFSECERCGGSGNLRGGIDRQNKPMTVRSPGPCEDCDGLGIILSVEGREVRDLIMRLKQHYSI